jgi:CRISPR-associated exonuclease Cas4
MEHTSDAVSEGKLIHETSYPQRADKYTEIEIGGSKIDFYDAKNKVIHEVKKSDSIEDAHEWQVKYYIWSLHKNGIENATGVIEYPKLKLTSKVELSATDVSRLEDIAKHIEAITSDNTCPTRINSKICKKCAYYDFCYVGEI